MRIDEYYNNAAKMNLNASLLALLPAVFITGGNLFVFRLHEIMLLTVPFLIYSIISFQMFLMKRKMSITLKKNLQGSSIKNNQSLLAAKKLVVFYHDAIPPKLMLYFPDGQFAGELTRFRPRGKSFTRKEKTFLLQDHLNHIVGFYKVKGRKWIKIEVYNHENEYIGCFEKSKQVWEKKDRKELLDASGRFVAEVEGAGYYMDEQVVNSNNRLMCRLQRGIMPLEWSRHFPEANTPVLSLDQEISEKNKILHMAILIHEFFIER